MIKLPETLQEIFDIVSKHLLKQNEKSKSPYMPELGLNCAYRGENGWKSMNYSKFTMTIQLKSGKMN